MALSEDLDLDISKAQAKLRTLQAQVDEVKRGLSRQTGGAFASGDIDKATTATQRLSTAFGKLQASGAKLASAGRSLTSLSLPIIAIGFAADRAAIKFENTFLRIQTLTNTATKDLGTFRKATLDLAGTFGQGPQDLAEALFFITSNGIQGAKALEVLKVSAQGAALQLGSTQVVASNITSIMNAYGKENLSAARILDILVAAERESKTAAAELVPVYGRVLPAAQALGVSFEEISGLLAFFTRTTGSASQAGTQLSNILQKIIKPSVEAQKVLKSIGITSVENFQNLVRQNGVLNTMQLIFAKLGGDRQKFATLVGNIRGISGALQLVGPSGADAAAAVQRVIDSVGDADKAFRQLQNNPAFQRKQAFAEFQAALINIGELLIPIGNQIINFGKSVAEAFLSLPEPIQKVIIALGAFIAAIGPIALGIGTFVQGIGALGAALANPAVLAAAAAITVAAVAFIGLTSSSREAAKAAREFRGALQDTTQDLDIERVATDNATQAHLEFAAAVNANVRARFKQHLVDRNQVDDLNRLGISLDDATKITGTFTEQQSILERVRRRALETGEVTFSSISREIKFNELRGLGLGKVADQYIKTGNAQDIVLNGQRIFLKGNTDLVTSFEKESTAAQTSTRQLVNLAAAGDAQAAAILKARGEWDKLTPAQQKVAQSALVAAAAGKQLQEAQKSQIGTASDAEQQYNDLIDSVVSTAQSYDTLTKAVSDAQNALLSLLGLPLAEAEQQLKWNSSLDEFKKQLKDSNAGLDESKVKNQDQLDAVRKNEQAYFDLVGQIQDTAKQELDHGKSIDEVKGKYKEQFDQLQFVAGAMGINSDTLKVYNALLGATPTDLETAIKLSGAQDAITNMQTFNDLISVLPPDAQTLVKAVGAKDAQAGLRLMAELIKKVPKETLTKAGIKDYPDAIKKLQTLGLDITHLSQSTAQPTVKVKDQATNTIADINNRLNNLGNKIVHPVVQVIRSNSQGGPLIIARGAILGTGGVKRMEAGGIERAPMIAHVRKGEGILWAEPVTHGESYIPHNPAQRARATAILDETARIFGMSLTRRTKRMADGGIFAGAPVSVAATADPAVARLATEVGMLSRQVGRLTNKVGDVNVSIEAKKQGSAVRELANAIQAARK